MPTTEPAATPQLCSVDTCDSPVKARGWCQSHYIHLRPMPVCKEEGCQERSLARGWCGKHYEMLRPAEPCKEDGCPGRAQVQGWCRKHYQQLRTSDKVCKIDTCNERVQAHGWCRAHYYKLRDTATGLPEPCTRETCDKPQKARGLCREHYQLEAGATEYTCPQCGKGFRGWAGRVYCSRRCKIDAATGPVHSAVKSGDPVAILAAVLTCVDIDPATECWNWKYTKSPAGYGCIGQGGSAGLVHRHVAAAAMGTLVAALPRSESIHHKCANRGCVNPAHLESILHRENMAEMFERKALRAKVAEQAAELAVLRAKMDERDPEALA